jgi:hypothetical protein
VFSQADEISFTPARRVLAIRLGGRPLIVMCPEHAQIIADGGFSKQEAKEFLYEHSRVKLSDFHRRPSRAWSSTAGPPVPLGQPRLVHNARGQPREIQVVVAGARATLGGVAQLRGGDHGACPPDRAQGRHPVKSVLEFRYR